MERIVVGLVPRTRADGRTEYLLVRSKKRAGGEKWYPPGGHIERGESAKEALVRELHEEFGVTARPIKELAIAPGDVPDSLIHLWSCEIGEGELKADHDELAAAEFFTLEEALKLDLWPATRGFLEGIEKEKIQV